MAVCSHCGAARGDGQKFCRQCGAQAQPSSAPVSHSDTNDNCQNCGAHVTPGAAFCRSCGHAAGESRPAPVQSAPLPRYDRAAPSRVVDPLYGAPRSPRAKAASHAWMYVSLSVAALLLLGVAAYFARPLFTRQPEPTDEVIASALARELPPFVQLTGAKLQALDRDVSRGEPSFNVRFLASGLLSKTVYLRGKVEDDILFLSEPAPQGTPLALSGSAILKRTADTWATQLTVDKHPLLDGATPDSFPGRRVIVEGSPEEAAYINERESLRAAAEQQAAAEQARQAELGRQEARRIADQAAAAERARVEAERQQNQRQQAADAERRRLEGEEQARLAEAAEARRLADEAARREAEAARVTVTPGRIPRNAETTVRLLSALKSDVVHVEDRFETVTTEDVVVSGRVLVPAGATVRGVVASVQPATRTNRTARLQLSFDLLTVGNHSIPLRARLTKVLSGPGLKGDAAKVGIAAGVGALIGGLLGGAQGAAIGGAVGGGGTLAATEGKEINLEPGSTLRIKFDEAVDIR